MALTQTAEARSFSIGTKRAQRISLTALSGDTSGTVTADQLGVLEQIIIPSAMVYTAAPTYATNVATLAFTVPTETAASKAIQDITYTAAANQGAGGNSITVTYSDTVEAGSEVATLVGTALTVTIDSGESTATQVLAAITAAAITGTVTAAITGTASNAQTAVTTTALTGGVTGGIFSATGLAIAR